MSAAEPPRRLEPEDARAAWRPQGEDGAQGGSAQRVDITARFAELWATLAGIGRIETRHVAAVQRRP